MQGKREYFLQLQGITSIGTPSNIVQQTHILDMVIKIFFLQTYLTKRPANAYIKAEGANSMWKTIVRPN